MAVAGDDPVAGVAEDVCKGLVGWGNAKRSADTALKAGKEVAEPVVVAGDVDPLRFEGESEPVLQGAGKKGECVGVFFGDAVKNAPGVLFCLCPAASPRPLALLYLRLQPVGGPEQVEDIAQKHDAKLVDGPSFFPVPGNRRSDILKENLEGICRDVVPAGGFVREMKVADKDEHLGTSLSEAKPGCSRAAGR